MTPIFSTDSPPSRYVTADGKRFLWFSGTDYLGLAYHPAFLRLLSEGLGRFGSHFGGSRNNTLRISAFRDAEIALSRFTGAEDALLVSSGMLAGYLIRSHLPALLHKLQPDSRYHELEAPMLHPALARSTRSTLSWDDWARSAAREIKDPPPGARYLIYSDAVGTPQTSSFDFSVFENLPGALIVVDDSHGIGVLGPSGEGSYALLKTKGLENVLVIASLNKALGIPGGVLLGSRTLLDAFRQTGTYSGASPVPPVYAHALTVMADQGAYREAHAALMANNDYFFEKLANRDRFFHIAGYPVYTAADPGLFDFLLQRGILASCFSYPSAEDPPLTRLVITAAHTREDLDLLAEACSEYYA